MRKWVVIGVLVFSGVARADADCDKLMSKATQPSVEWLRASAIQQFSCSNQDINTSWGEAYWLDRPGAATSEVARAWHVLKCLPRLTADTEGKRLYEALGAWAVCGVDARRIDWKAAGEEVKKLPPRAKQRLDEVKALVGVYETWVTKAIAADPQVKKVAVDAPEAAFKAWEDLYAKNKALIDLAYAVEDKAVAAGEGNQWASDKKVGCEELRGALRTYVAGKKPKTRDDVKAALLDPVGFVAFERLALCDAREGRLTDAASAQALMSEGRVHAGPRLAARWAATEAAMAVKMWKDFSVSPDGIRGEVATSEVSRLAKTIWEDKLRGVSSLSEGQGEGDQSSNRIQQARVAGAKKDAGGVLLTFKEEKWSENDWQCTRTSFSHWSLSGEPIYNSSCKVVGSHIETYQMQPRLVSEWSATGVKAGQIVKLAVADRRSGDGPTPAFVVEVGEMPKGKKQPTPVSYWGVPLK